jgi:2-keto-4-pentenoate hydratase/2-oxohepta-3-ene-1,7-dioic acid hydratase in catechol pathway
MRIMNVDGRLSLVVGEGIVDAQAASGGAFGADVQGCYARWDELRAWARGYDGGPTGPVPAAGVGPPVPRPPQVFGIGLNYRAHAAESGIGLPDAPMVFTKFPASVTGPYDAIPLPNATVDYEAELVAVIGRRARHVPEEAAWSYVAGLTVGQDLSDRALQAAPPAPAQFNLAKSYEGFAPIGPLLVTPDELDDPGDLELGCRLNGEPMQETRTSDLIFAVPRLVSYLSGILPLLPGDLIFTGTPSGVGAAREPQRFLRPGDELVTYLTGIGEMRHRFVADPG